MVSTVGLLNFVISIPRSSGHNNITIYLASWDVIFSNSACNSYVRATLSAGRAMEYWEMYTQQGQGL